MRTSFSWGVLFGLAVGVILLGHNGILADETTCARNVSPRYVFTTSGCQRDWPSFANVCHAIDRQGNRIIKTGF